LTCEDETIAATLNNSALKPQPPTPEMIQGVTPLLNPASPGHFDELTQAISIPPNSAEADQANAQKHPNGLNLSDEWLNFFEFLGPHGVQDLSRRNSELSRQIRDNGVTYNVYADRNSPIRPWSVDVFPLIISTSDWNKIEKGVLQRVSLLEKMMVDLYGDQKLLKDSLLPAALVQGHTGYLRPMHNVTPPGGRHLHIAAFDLAHGPDGQWWLVAQRTQAPSGLGYLLENRILVSRQFPDAFDAMAIQRLAGTYRSLIESLKMASPGGRDAQIVLLTPGPYSETYFEHAYLARYLGLPLVEGGDLTVRDSKLFLKTLSGLQPVHGLLKRLDDEFLDPLELRADSMLGIPGLLQVIRSGNVLVANTPGSGFLESPALLGFMPGISMALTGEALELPALATWWCGEKAALSEATSYLKQSVIKPTYPGRLRGTGGAGSSIAEEDFQAVLCQNLSDEDINNWIKTIELDPHKYTLQSYLPLSQMPTWMDATDKLPAGIIPRSMMLRVFAVSDGANSWKILPGGMARISPPGEEISSIQRGGSSADVWVQTNKERDTSTMLKRNLDLHLLESRKRLVTSRAAENLYWLGRYTERAENTVRLARLSLQSLRGDEKPSSSLLLWLERMAEDFRLIPEGVPASDMKEKSEVDLKSGSKNTAPVETTSAPKLHLIANLFERTLIDSLDLKGNVNSVGFNLSALEQAGYAVRDRLSQESWNLIVNTRREFSNSAKYWQKLPDGASIYAINALDKTSASLAAITGAQSDRMTRDDGWRLLSCGRHIERLGFLSTALEMAIECETLQNLEKDTSGFNALLSLFDSTITYQAQFQESREIGALLMLLIKDSDNPRSVGWVANALRGRLSKLAGSAPDELSEMASKVPSQADWTLDQLCEIDASGKLTTLLKTVGAFKVSTWYLNDAITEKYFTHTLESERSLSA